MKTRNAILTFSLAALAFGAAAGLAMHHANAVETRAEPAATTRLYLDMSGFADWYSASASFKVHTWNEAKGDKTFAATKVGDAYYYADFDLETYASGGGYRFTRFSSDGSSEWNRGAWRSYADGVQTYYRASDWTSGEWSKEDQKTWKVVGATYLGAWGDIEIDLTMRFNDEGLAYYSTEVSLTAQAEFKVRKTETPSDLYYGYNCILEGEGSVLDLDLVEGEGTSNITVKKSGTYEIYMKPFEGKFWMQENSVASATAFSEDFLVKTDTACAGEGDDHGNALKEIWNVKNTPDGTSLSEKWSHLTQGAKNAFKTNEEATIKSARDRYVFLMGKYSSILTQFDQGPDYSTARYSVGLTETNNTLLVVSIVSALTVVTVAGLFLFKKKKSIR
ncbi:MAG: hypothetical protein SPL02_00320 [Bacilli bacterium]|nr:hypothetical protein [Bacilli bacterium]MDY6430295.1 hypothetical protein [Bacilli bacterium]